MEKRTILTPKGLRQTVQNLTIFDVVCLRPYYTVVTRLCQDQKPDPKPYQVTPGQMKLQVFVSVYPACCSLGSTQKRKALLTVVNRAFFMISDLLTT